VIHHNRTETSPLQSPSLFLRSSYMCPLVLFSILRSSIVAWLGLFITPSNVSSCSPIFHWCRGTCPSGPSAGYMRAWVITAYVYFTTPKNLETENSKNGKLRRPKFLPVHHIKEVTRFGEKDKDENEKCMASCEDLVGNWFLVLWFALVSFIV